MKDIVTFAFLFISLGLSAQNTLYDKYNWNTIPETSISDTVKTVDGAKVIFERRIKEIYLNKDNYFEEINVFHRRIRVETHDAIDNYNKIYVPVSDVIDILNIKARFISATGKITELPQESIKELENPENKGNFKLFAIEGAEIGGDIEYFYTLRNAFDAYGTVTVQGDEPINDLKVIFLYPSKLEYLIKSYNGFPDFVTTDDSAGQTILEAKAEYIPSLKEERYANYKSYLMRYEYTLAYNRYNSSLRTYSWSKVSNNLYNNAYQLSKSEKSAVKKVVNQLGIRNVSEQEKIRRIENHVKSEYAISEAILHTPSLDQIIKYKQSSKFGVSKLCIALLNEADVPFDMVLTCKKDKKTFDPDFNGWNFLDDYLIYFPDLNQFIAPDDASCRLGVIPSDYQGIFGLFMHPINYNDKLGTLAYDIKKLPLTPYSDNCDSLFITLSCDLKQMKSDINIHRVMTGIMASSFQSFWEMVDAERHLTITNNVFDMGDKNTTILSQTLKNTSVSDIGVRPFIWDIHMGANTLIESAGSDYIINIGRTIGSQSELYQTNRRKLPVDLDFEHNYYRKIQISIPVGYKIVNPEDLNMKVEMMLDGKVSAFFTSWYEISDGSLIVYSKEVYPELHYPVDRFNDFRDVINAAADFNKKTLVLTPVSVENTHQ